MNRRRFLRLLSVTGGMVLVDWQGLLGAREEVSAALLDGMERVNHHFVLYAPTTPVFQHYEGLMDHLDFLRSLTPRRMSPSLRTRLDVITSEAARQTGFRAYLFGDSSQAQRLLNFAAQLATEAQDRQQLAAVLISESALWSSASTGGEGGDPEKALEITEAAVQAAGPHGHPQLRMAARTARAEQYAVRGDLNGCMYDLYQAREIMTTEKWERPYGVDPRTSVELAAVEGSCLTLLGNRHAVPTLERVVASMVGRVSWQATVLADLGAAYAQAQEPEQAATTLVSALELTRKDGAQHNVARIRGIRRRLLNGPDVPPLRELDELLG